MQLAECRGKGDMRSQGSYNLQLPRREMTQLGVFHYRSEFPFAAPEGSKHLSEGHQSVLNGSFNSCGPSPPYTYMDRPQAVLS